MRRAPRLSTRRHVANRSDVSGSVHGYPSHVHARSKTNGGSYAGVSRRSLRSVTARVGDGIPDCRGWAMMVCLAVGCIAVYGFGGLCGFTGIFFVMYRQVSQAIYA